MWYPLPNSVYAFDKISMLDVAATGIYIFHGSIGLLRVPSFVCEVIFQLVKARCNPLHMPAFCLTMLHGSVKSTLPISN